MRIVLPLVCSAALLLLAVPAAAAEEMPLGPAGLGLEVEWNHADYEMDCSESGVDLEVPHDRRLNWLVHYTFAPSPYRVDFYGGLSVVNIEYKATAGGGGPIVEFESQDGLGLTVGLDSRFLQLGHNFFLAGGGSFLWLQNDLDGPEVEDASLTEWRLAGWLERPFDDVVPLAGLEWTDQNLEVDLDDGRMTAGLEDSLGYFLGLRWEMSNNFIAQGEYHGVSKQALVISLSLYF